MSSAVASSSGASTASANAKAQASAPSSAKKVSRSSKPDKYEGNPDRDLPGIGNYMFIKTLGEGNFAKVKLAKHKLTGQEVAIKVIDKTKLDDKKLGKLYREVRIMKLLKHPNIVRLYEVVETKATVFLVMEYASGGELYDYLVVHGKMREKEARAKFRQILSAVSYCHKKRVIHRDLKAENLLLDTNLNIKIADFGFSNYYDPDDKLDTFCGSPPYAAPELFQGRRYTGPEVDVWSLGVILYVLTTGCLPFDGKNLQEMRESVCRGKYRVPFYLSDNCEKLLRKFLVRDPARRASLDIVVDDPWINDGYNDSPVVTDISQNVGEDEEVVRIMESKFKIDRQTIYKSLRENVYDDVAAVYYLLYHERDIKMAENGDGQNTEAFPGAKSASASGERSNFAERRAASNGNLPIPKSAGLDPNQAANNDGDSGAAPGAGQSAAHGASGTAAAHGGVSGAQAGASANAGSGAGANAAAGAAAGGAANNAAAAAAAAARKPRRRRFTVGGEADVLQYADDDDSRAAAEALKLKVPGTADAGVDLPQQPLPQPAGMSLQKKLAMAEEAGNGADANNGGNYSAASGTPVEDGISDSSEVGPDGRIRRKRNNTFVGIIRSHIARRTDSAGASGPASASATGQAPGGPSNAPAANATAGAVPPSPGGVQSSGASTDEDKPRALRFTFASNSTSSRPPDEVVQEVLNALDSKNVQYALPSRYLIAASAQNGALKFEIEICKLPRLNNLHGLRFKRLAGSSGDYKDICEQILAIVKL